MRERWGSAPLGGVVPGEQPATKGEIVITVGRACAVVLRACLRDRLRI